MYLTIIDHIEIDREQRSLRKDGKEIHLTGLEYGFEITIEPEALRQMLDSVLTALLRMYLRR